MSCRGLPPPAPERSRCPSPRSRRQLVAAGLTAAVLVLTAALTACTPSDPRVDPGSPVPSASGSTPVRATPSRTTAPAPPLRSTTLSSAEQQLADLSAAVLAGPHRSDLTSRQRRLLVAVRDAHLQHVTALTGQQPTTRPVRPPATATPSRASSSVATLSLAKSLTLVARQELKQAGRARRVAVATNGFDALLAGSLTVASASYADAVTAKRPPELPISDDAHHATAAVSDVAGVQSMVRQLHAIVYGYQIALGHLPASGGQGRALRSLRYHRAMRDSLEQELVDRSAAVPAAAAAYVPPVRPTSPARSARLIRRMEVALQPFCGLWLASATTQSERSRAVDTLSRTVTTAHSWGAPLTVWPGWQD